MSRVFTLDDMRVGIDARRIEYLHSAFIALQAAARRFPSSVTRNRKLRWSAGS